MAPSSLLAPRREAFIPFRAPLTPSNPFIRCDGPRVFRGSLTVLLYLKTFPQAGVNSVLPLGPHPPSRALCSSPRKRSLTGAHVCPAARLLSSCSLLLGCPLVLLADSYSSLDVTSQKTSPSGPSLQRTPTVLELPHMAYVALLCNHSPPSTCFRGVLAKDGTEALVPGPAALCFYETGISERFKSQQLLVEKTFDSFPVSFSNDHILFRLVS